MFICGSFAKFLRGNFSENICEGRSSFIGLCQFEVQSLLQQIVQTETRWQITTSEEKYC